MAMEQFERLVGSWTTEATHPMMPGVVVHGTAVVEWLEGKQFLILRSRTDHEKFPDSISIIGSVERDRADGERKEKLSLHYYDSRGVFRDYDTSMDDDGWKWSRMAPKLSQRFTGKFTDANTISGTFEMCEDDVHWKDDLKITYRRA